LLFISIDDQLPTVWIREKKGTTVTTTDISQFLTVTQPVELDGARNLVSYAIRIFTFDNQQGTRFSVSGLATLRRGRIVGHQIGPLLRVRVASMKASGNGTVANNNVVLTGSIDAGTPIAETGPE
jgi:hypothetical protein